MAANALTERYVTAIRDIHIAQSSAHPSAVAKQDGILNSIIDSLRGGLPGVDDAVLGEVLVHVAVELSVIHGALKQTSLDPAVHADNMINALGLAGVRLFISADGAG